MGIRVYDRPVSLEELERTLPYSPFVEAEEVLDTYSGPLFAGVGVYAGAIYDIEIEYDSVNPHVNPDAPVAPSIPLGKSVLIHVWAKNTGTDNIKPRIEWLVKKPNGIIAENYADTASFSISPGELHHFIGGRFDVNMSGLWTMEITLKRIY